MEKAFKNTTIPEMLETQKAILQELGGTCTEPPQLEPGFPRDTTLPQMLEIQRQILGRVQGNPVQGGTSAKIPQFSGAPAVGQIYKVSNVGEDGTVTMEPADMPETGKKFYFQSLPISYDGTRIIFRPNFKRELLDGDEFWFRIVFEGVTAKFTARPGVMKSDTTALFINTSEDTVPINNLTQWLTVRIRVVSNNMVEAFQYRITKNQLSDITNAVSMYALGSPVQGLYIDISSGGTVSAMRLEIYSTVELEV